MPVTSRENIEKWSLSYQITKWCVDISFRLYFPKKVVGQEKIDFNDILIFAPNHQNALIDALAILTMRKWQPVFLARADIFRKHLLDKILTFLKILPIYRIRDGYGELQRNNKIFKKTIDVLNNRNGLCILPEGNHAGVHRLRQLKKGIARIAFQAIEASGGQMKIKIVPVGLEYSHYYKFGSPMLVRLGEPFDVSEYYTKSRENYAVAIKELVDELAARMKKEMIHIENDMFYDEYNIIRQQGALAVMLRNRKKVNRANLFEAEKNIITALNTLQNANEAGFNRLMTLARTFKLNLTHARIEVPIYPSELKGFGLLLQIPALLVTLPLFVCGSINSMLPLGVIALISSKIKDPQFLSSFRYVTGFLLFPLFMLIQTAVFALVFKNGWQTLFYFIALPISGLLMQQWRKLFFQTFRQVKLLFIRLTKPTLFGELKNNLKMISLEL
ncbi:MAG: 1-acyl-sn-glycerol-3-phosphate acyltransferase [Cytophagaceae bacterium]|jgi:1-acyl-sn-glycerol-3-phosphate acyltransferase|nr:1-acyl-sn-glycerol-3-phosphate acyltransferase [Cytophagaceae bacterium]